MANAVYPGSFDPITLGHLDIIKRMQPLVGEITILISNNPHKNGLFTAKERKELAEKAVRGLEGVQVEIHEGLTIDYVRMVGAKSIIRGLRAVSDYEYELVMANMNKKLAPGIETLIVFASPEFYYIASNTVKEVAMNGGRVHDLVPRAVEQALKAKFASRVKILRASQQKQKETLKVAKKAAAKVVAKKRK